MMKPLSEKRIDTLNGYKYSEEDVKEAVEKLEKYIIEKETKTTNETRIKLDILEMLYEIMGRFE